MAGRLLVLTILMIGASFRQAAMYTIDVTALTRRVCHRQRRIGSVGIRTIACRCVWCGDD